jgi:IS1 family transposase
VANVLCGEKQIAVLRLLSEGNSIRSTERLTGVHRDTIMRLTIRFGNNCRSFLDDALMNLKLQHVQCDEIWTFCRMKEGQAKQRNLDTTVIGDQYLYTALDTDTKLLVTFAIGKRGWETTNAFIRDLRKRLVTPETLGDERPQLSTDGFTPYLPAIRRHFQGAARHGVLKKLYAERGGAGRYSPGPLVGTERINVNGINDLATICTSHVERMNGSIRQFVKRFTRLTYAFSKRLGNLAAACALHAAVYNFVRVHRSLGCTPAMAAGIVGELWDMDRLFDAVTEHANRKVRDARLERLIDRLGRNA